MQKLATKIVDKPWGKRGIASRFGVAFDRQVGEIWFEPPAGRELDVMVKYLFTTERLSIQVHPDDATARERGFPRGKDEWIVSMQLTMRNWASAQCVTSRRRSDRSGA